MTISNYLEPRILDHILTSSTTPFVTTTDIFASLHTGDPGETGTASPLASTPRFSVHMGVAVSSTNSNDTTASVVCSATGTVTFIGLWDGTSTALANHLWSGALTASRVVANVGDSVTLAVNGLTVTLD